MTSTLFKREIMKLLIDDDKCLDKLITMRNQKELKRWSLEEEIKKLNLETLELNELIVYLRAPPEEKQE